MMAVKNKVLRYLIIAMVAALAALNYEIFVFPNNFAPAGLNGFLTIIRHLTGFTFGYMSLLMNIPLLVIAFKVLKRHYAIFLSYSLWHTAHQRTSAPFGKNEF